MYDPAAVCALFTLIRIKFIQHAVGHGGIDAQREQRKTVQAVRTVERIGRRGRHCRGNKALVRYAEMIHARQTEGAHLLSRMAVGIKIPGTAAEAQLNRLGRAMSFFAVGRIIVEFHNAAV